MDTGFDTPRFNAAVELINDSWYLKPDLAAAPSLASYNLSGIQAQDIQVVRSVKGTRLQFPHAVPDQRLSFAAEKLFQGICAGDFTDADDQQVQVYYPHEREGKLVGKTVFTMNIDDAKRVAQTSFEALGAPKELFADAIKTRRQNALFKDTMKVHEHDIIGALA